MKIEYNVEIPAKRARNGGNRSEESNALLGLLKDKDKENMSISYDTEEEAKKKATTLKAFAKKRGLNAGVDIYRIDSVIYIKKKQSEKTK
jgi:hypothetical protein